MSSDGVKRMLMNLSNQISQRLAKPEAQKTTREFGFEIPKPKTNIFNDCSIVKDLQIILFLFLKTCNLPTRTLNTVLINKL